MHKLDPAGGSEPFVLKGFYAEDTVEGLTLEKDPETDKLIEKKVEKPTADLMVLRLEYGNRLGLIFATRRQSLTPDSP